MDLEELGVPCESRVVAQDAIKKLPYTNINPNGRTPAIQEPNTGITLWESGAILEYLVKTYDKDNQPSIPSFPEKYHLKQYLHFQMSGQGPYYEQTMWFRTFHPEDVPSAKKRYDEQLVRVVEVLDGILKNKTYLVDEKCTYADIVFIPWNNVIGCILGAEAGILLPESRYPNFWAWHNRLLARPAVQTGLAAQAKIHGR